MAPSLGEAATLAAPGAPRLTDLGIFGWVWGVGPQIRDLWIVGGLRNSGRFRVQGFGDSVFLGVFRV